MSAILVGLAACATHPPPTPAVPHAAVLETRLVASKLVWGGYDNRMPEPGVVAEQRTGGSVTAFDGKLVVKNVSNAPVVIHFPSGIEWLSTVSTVEPISLGTIQGNGAREGVAGPHDVTLAAGGTLELPIGSITVPLDGQHAYFLDVVLAAGDPSQRVASSLRLEVSMMGAY